MDFEIQLAYIDPGTGSILFSILIGCATALYFVGKAAFIKVKFLITGKGTSSASGYSPFVVYNEGKQYWNVFKPVLEEFEKRGISVVYYTSAKDDPFFDESFRHVTGTYIGEGNKACMRLNFLQADICLMTTPSLEVYQLKRSKGVKHYAHILHDTGDVTFYRLFGIDWFDSILLSGEYQKKDIRELERIRKTREKELVVVGSAYLDVLREKKELMQTQGTFKESSREGSAYTVLVSPSWGSGALLSAFGEKLLDPLVHTGWRIIVRPHPQSRKSEMGILARLQARYAEAANVEWDYSPENLLSLSRADVMISDYSGIIFDFVFLFEKPVLYASSHFDLEMYDASDIDHAPWKFEAVKTFGIELNDEQLCTIQEIILRACENKEFGEAVKRARDTAWQHIGESGKRAADYLVSRQSLCSGAAGGPEHV
ncbi:MAG: CDP-glycerol glycerophosphotransferase family protein [Spirochaetia bacterium]|jgi:hypothetical protein|nr:CDP-glycerol glycerophosphotransferase family protein [Spirochaetia bacterium]